MTSNRRIKVWVNTGFAGCEHYEYYPLPDMWDEMTEEEQEAQLQQMAEDYHDDCIDYGAHVEERGDA